MVWVFRAYLAVAAAALMLAVGGLLIPAGLRVERSVYIERPPATVFTLAARPASFAHWSPQAMDGEAGAFTTQGPELGVGAVARWTDADGRSARLRILEAQPYALVDADVDFGAYGRLRSSVSITPRDGGALVNWSVETRFGLNIIRRYAGLGLRGRLGADLEAGLERLRAHAEALPPGDFATAEIRRGPLRPRPIAYVERTASGGPNAQETAFAEALVEVRRFLRDQGVADTGTVHAARLDWRPPLWRFRAAIAYDAADAREAMARSAGAGGPVRLGQTPSGEGVTIVHRGDGRATSQAYGRLEAYLAAHGLRATGPVWEAQLTDRASSMPDEHITEIFVTAAPAP